MTNDEPECFIRNFGIDNNDSKCMAISLVMMKIKNNACGSNIKITEPYIIDDEIPHVLRTVATYTKSEGLVIVKQDEVFESFIKKSGLDIPDSKCLKYLNTLSL